MNIHTQPKELTYSDFLSAYGITAEKAEVYNAFVPGNLARRFEAFRNRTRFAHYTSADVALSIVRNQSVWLRNASAMNDYKELHHGIDRLIKFFGKQSEAAKPFWERLGQLHDDIADEIMGLYDGWLNDLRYNTYMICLSEHLPKEDRTGRLSMWRAYAPRNGLALVLNPRPFHSATDALEAYSHPVMYFDDEQLKSVFEGIVSNIATSDTIAALSREEIRDNVFQMLESFSIGLKHPGFEEEREWRVVFRPARATANRIQKSVQVVRGMPQRIYSLPLKNIEDEGLFGVAIPELIDRIIVGPSQLPLLTYEALVDELINAGVANAAEKVTVSDIPLRI